MVDLLKKTPQMPDSNLPFTIIHLLFPNELTDQEFEESMWSCLSSTFSTRVTLPVSRLISDARLQRLVHSFLPCLLPILRRNKEDPSTSNRESSSPSSLSSSSSSTDVAVKILRELFASDQFVTLVPSMIPGKRCYGETK